jgi:aromatic ring-opening dioxygenase LigB subunit
MAKKQLKEFEVLESKAYIVHAFDEAHALRKFGNYDYVSEGDYWPDVRELGPVNSSGTGPQ